tara:strand:+ start:459 stop:578 length:120 start_codon:yes stop_codon:yes gene_type:complete
MGMVDGLQEIRFPDLLVIAREHKQYKWQWKYAADLGFHT